MTPQTADHSTVWYLPHMQNLRLMKAHYIEHAFKPHAHDYFVLGIVEAGLQTFTYKRELLTTAPGGVIVINPGEIHTGEAAIKSGFVYRALYPTQDMMEWVGEEFRNKPKRMPRFEGGIIHDIELYRGLQHIHRLSENAETLLDIEQQTTTVFVELIRRHSRPNFTFKQYHSAHDAVLLVREYLEAHYAENVSLSDLSAVAHISPYHLARLFTKQMGVPPHRYLENVRINHAERLLAGGMPIADVAYATGFSSQSHLTKTFKRFIGTTPGEFIKERKII